MSISNFDEAIAKSNDTIYGLTATIWTHDIKKAHCLAHAIKACTVWINTMFDSASPYGVYRMRGFVTEQSLEAFNFYTQTKTVWINLNQ
ncbi:MAG: aldehyde dehydrogenase family protein [Blastocatellia bacterium]